MHSTIARPKITYTLETVVHGGPELRFTIVHRNNRTCYYTATMYQAVAVRDILNSKYGKLQSSNFWQIQVYAWAQERSTWYNITNLCVNKVVDNEVRKLLKESLVIAGVPDDSSLERVFGKFGS